MQYNIHSITRALTIIFTQNIRRLEIGKRKRRGIILILYTMINIIHVTMYGVAKRSIVLRYFDILYIIYNIYSEK